MRKSAVHNLIIAMKVASVPLLYLLYLPFPQQPARTKNQDRDEDPERDRIAVGRKTGAGDERLDQADNHAAERRTGDVADAAEHRCDEGFESRQNPHERFDRWILRTIEHAPRAGQRAANNKRKR